MVKHRRVLGGLLALAISAVGLASFRPPSADVAACVRVSGGNFDAPGNDNQAGILLIQALPAAIALVLVLFAAS